MSKALRLQQKHVESAKVYGNRVDLIRALADRLAGGRIAELGVAFGDFSHVLLECLKPARFDALDTFQLHELDRIWGKTAAEHLGGQTHRRFYEARFATEIDKGVVRILEGDGATNLATQSGAYDMIYLDGGHDYDTVSRDAEAATAKLAPDGVLIFNDYVHYDHLTNDHYGVVEVVNNLCVNHGWQMTGFAFEPDMFCDVMLERTPLKR